MYNSRFSKQMSAIHQDMDMTTSTLLPRYFVNRQYYCNAPCGIGGGGITLKISVPPCEFGFVSILNLRLDEQGVAFKHAPQPIFVLTKRLVLASRKPIVGGEKKQQRSGVTQVMFVRTCGQD